MEEAAALDSVKDKSAENKMEISNNDENEAIVSGKDMENGEKLSLQQSAKQDVPFNATNDENNTMDESLDLIADSKNESNSDENNTTDKTLNSITEGETASNPDFNVPLEKESEKDVSEKDSLVEESKQKSAQEDADMKSATITPEDPEKSNQPPKSRRKRKLVDQIGDESPTKLLRKLPTRKSLASPSKPSDTRSSGMALKNIISISQRLRKCNRKSLKPLYRVMYFQWPPDDSNKTIRDVLEFKGFSFNKKSDDFVKRKRELSNLLPETLERICDLLDVKKGAKHAMISNIVHFLLKPIPKYDPSVDISLQPYVQLEKLELDNSLLKNIAKMDNLKPSLRPLGKNVAPPKPVTPKAKPKDTTISDKTPISDKELKEKKKIISPVPETVKRKGRKFKRKPAVKVGQIGIAVIQRKKMGVRIIREALPHCSPAKAGNTGVAKNKLAVAGTSKPTEVASPPKSYVHTNIKEEPTSPMKKGNESSEETLSSDEVINKNKDNDSSEETLSSDEVITPKKEPIRIENVVSRMKKVRPLSSFPQIVERIIQADSSSLQRLHILIFGASEDRESRLKENILAFGGFPFLEKSKEWLEKEFLLSLLAVNTLKEYLEMLCIPHNDEPQNLLIKKLMKFLAAPGRSMLGNVPKRHNVSKTVKIAPRPPNVKKVIKKKEEKPKAPRHRKVLMDEEQVRRLEADIAREQRIIEREKKLFEQQKRKQMEMDQNLPIIDEPNQPTAKQTHGGARKQNVAVLTPATDLKHLDLLLQNVRSRKSLMKAGIVLPHPNKGTKTKLGDIPNVKFMVITANMNDLEILHRLIFLFDSTKSRIRKNILDFDGFRFAEDTVSYNKRKDYLFSLGYDISKRVAFVLGLSPFETKVPQEDLNDLILYFLMAPSSVIQVPIKYLPQNFFTDSSNPKRILLLKGAPGPSPLVTTSHVKEGTPAHLGVLANQIAIANEQHGFGPSKLAKLSVNKQNISTSDAAPAAPVRKLVLNQQAFLPKQGVIYQQPSTNSATLPSPPQLIIPNTQPFIQNEATPVLNLLPQSDDQEPNLFVCQQPGSNTPKTFKIIRLRSDHPFTMALQKTNSQPAAPMSPQTVQLPTSAPLQPGFIFIKKPGTEASQSFVSGVNIASPEQRLITNFAQQELYGEEEEEESPEMEYVLPDEGDTDIQPECDVLINDDDDDDDVQILEPLDDPPTDEAIFSAIQDVIENSKFEDVTVRNVIDRVSARFPDYDLRDRHAFMKECVKNIIIRS